jgi:hypothetical protein
MSQKDNKKGKKLDLSPKSKKITKNNKIETKKSKKVKK